MIFETITDYLEYQTNEFKKEISQMDLLCDLRNVSFESGHVPDYNDRAQALLYCLRYHFGYAFEYEHIYSKYVLNEYSYDRINVLSIGCGNGIDLWSLHHAIERNDTGIHVINYHGIDKVNWREYFFEENEGVSYHKCEVQEFTKSLGRVDVLILPKSISELSGSDLNHIAQIINACTNRIYIIASFRSDDFNLSKDKNMYINLIHKFVEYGFSVIRGVPDNCYYFEDDDAIITYYDDYYFPNDTLSLLMNLSSICNFSDEDGTTKSCNCHIERYPILKVNQVRFNCVLLERE